MGGIVTSGGRSRWVGSSLPEGGPDGWYRHFRRDVPMGGIVTSRGRSRWVVSFRDSALWRDLMTDRYSSL